MKLTSKERKKIYDRWHKEVYQIDVDKSMEDQGKLHKKILEYAEINKNSKLKLLDLACGKGLFLKELKSYNNNLDLYGVDISKVAIDYAKKIVDSNFQESDAESLPFKDNFFDRIVCLGGIEYFQDPVKGAREASRVLNKEGLAVFFVPNLMFFGYIWLALRYGIMPTHGGSSDNKVYYDYNNEKFFTYKGWEDIFKKGNLSIVSSARYTYFGNTKFASPIVLWLYNKIFYRMLPFNLSYAFIFVCRKKR